MTDFAQTVGELDKQQAERDNRAASWIAMILAIMAGVCAIMLRLDGTDLLGLEEAARETSKNVITYGAALSLVLGVVLGLRRGTSGRIAVLTAILSVIALWAVIGTH